MSDDRFRSLTARRLYWVGFCLGLFALLLGVARGDWVGITLGLLTMVGWFVVLAFATRHRGEYPQ